MRQCRVCKPVPKFHRPDLEWIVETDPTSSRVYTLFNNVIETCVFMCQVHLSIFKFYYAFCTVKYIYIYIFCCQSIILYIPSLSLRYLLTAQATSNCQRHPEVSRLCQCLSFLSTLLQWAPQQNSLSASSNGETLRYVSSPNLPPHFTGAAGLLPPFWFQCAKYPKLWHCRAILLHLQWTPLASAESKCLRRTNNMKTIKFLHKKNA